MKFIGAHVGSEANLAEAPLLAREIGARSFALTVVDPKTWRWRDYTAEEVEGFRNNCAMCGFGPELILPHARLLLNLGSPDNRKLALSRIALTDEMNRCGRLGLTMINFHPGAHLNAISETECLDRIAESIDRCLDKTSVTEGSGVSAIIENTAGQGTVMGWSFGQIGYIISRMEHKDRVGVCIDTCHAFAAGYDLATEEGYMRAWEEFDREIGRERLRAMHINDSARALGSRIDRHADAGEGMIGTAFYERMMRDSRFDNIPLILETPSPEKWQHQIAWLYSLE